MTLGMKVSVDGKISRIVAAYAQGRHIKYILEDGRQFFDLHEKESVEFISDESEPSFREESVLEDSEFGEDLHD